VKRTTSTEWLKFHVREYFSISDGFDIAYKHYLSNLSVVCPRKRLLSIFCLESISQIA
jgi:hypothetical protein